MRFVALDIDKKTALATFLPNNQAQFQQRIELHDRGLIAFQDTLLPDDILCMEACPGSFHVAAALVSHVAAIKLVNPTKFGRILQANKQKTDRNDSGLMSRLLMANALPTVWLPDAETRDDRLLAEHCRTLQAEKTRIQNRIHALLTEAGFGPQADEMLRKDAHLLQARLTGQMTPLALELLASHLRLKGQVELELEQAKAHVVARAQSRKQCDLAATIPGVDHFLGLAMTSALGEIGRFESAASVRNYAGLSPTLRSSGKGKHRHGRITKRGSVTLRWAAIEAAQNAVRTPGRFKNKYARLRRKGKARHVAIVAIAGDLLETLWHMMTKSEIYLDTTPAHREHKVRRRRAQQVAATDVLATKVKARDSIEEGLETVREALATMAA